MGIKGVCSWHAGLAWQEAATEDTPSRPPVSPTAENTHRRHTAVLACPRLTALPRTTGLFPLLRRVLSSTCKPFLVPLGKGFLHPCSCCPFSIWEGSNCTVSLRSGPDPHEAWGDLRAGALPLISAEVLKGPVNLLKVNPKLHFPHP